MSFWERLYTLCEQKGCKPNTVAKAIGLSTATATKWKNGAIPNGEALIHIADYLDCSVDYLLGRTDDPLIKIQKSSPSNNEKEPIEIGIYKDAEMLTPEEIKKLKEFLKSL